MTISGSKRHAPSGFRLIVSPFFHYSFFFSLFLMLSLVIIGSLESLSHAHHSPISFGS